MGCPPHRRIEVFAPGSGSSTSSGGGGSGSGSGSGSESASSEGVSDGEVGSQCDSSNNHCAIRYYYGNSFRPVVVLYDDDLVNGKVCVYLTCKLDYIINSKQCQIVGANFIVWEATGRTDYTFSKLVHRAGCIRTPQKRSDFKETRLPDGTIDLDWSPSTYKSCFEGSPGRILGGTYQVYIQQLCNDDVTNICFILDTEFHFQFDCIFGWRNLRFQGSSGRFGLFILRSN